MSTLPAHEIKKHACVHKEAALVYLAPAQRGLTLQMLSGRWTANAGPLVLFQFLWIAREITALRYYQILWRGGPLRQESFFGSFLQSSKYMICVWYKRFLKVPSVVALPTTWSLTESALCAHQHAQMWGNSTETSSLEGFGFSFFFLQVLCPTESICKNPSLMLTFFSPFYCSSERWSHIGFMAPRLSVTFSAFQKSHSVAWTKLRRSILDVKVAQFGSNQYGNDSQWWKCKVCSGVASIALSFFLLRGV